MTDPETGRVQDNNRSYRSQRSQRSQEIQGDPRDLESVFCRLLASELGGKHELLWPCLAKKRPWYFDKYNWLQQCDGGRLLYIVGSFEKLNASAQVGINKTEEILRASQSQLAGLLLLQMYC